MTVHVDRVDATHIYGYLDRDDLINMLRGIPVDLRGPLIGAEAAIDGKGVPYVLHINNQTRQVTWNKEALLGASLKSLQTLYLSLKGVKPETEMEVEYERPEVKERLPAVDALAAIVHELNKSPLGQDFELKVGPSGQRAVVYQNLLTVYRYEDSPSAPVEYTTLLREVCRSTKQTLASSIDNKTYVTLIRFIGQYMLGAKF